MGKYNSESRHLAPNQIAIQLQVLRILTSQVSGWMFKFLLLGLFSDGNRNRVVITSRAASGRAVSLKSGSRFGL